MNITFELAGAIAIIVSACAGYELANFMWGF